MGTRVRAGTWLMAALAGMPALGYGHGRNSTSVRADVHAERVEVVIEAIVLDLLQMGGTEVPQWHAMDAAGRAASLKRGVAEMLDGFQIVADRRTPLAPAGMDTRLPDVVGAAGRERDLGQQSVRVRLDYPLDEPPRELTFLADFSDQPAEQPVLAQVLVRQEGEMVLLPAELGHGFPVSVSFDWQEGPASIAELEDLTAVTCSWRNRPACGFLEIGRDRVEWTLVAPARLLAELASLGDDVRPETWEAHLATGFEIHLNGNVLRPQQVELKILPPSAHAFSHGHAEAPQAMLDGMIQLVLRYKPGEDAVRIEARCNLLSGAVPVLFTRVRSGTDASRHILTPDAPSLVWTLTP